MIVETIVIKSRVTKLELVAHYSGNYNYGLSVGESCYSIIIEHNGCEYVICIDKSYDRVHKAAEYFTEDIGFPLIVNRVTRLRNDYNVVRTSVCVGAFSRSYNIPSSSSGNVDFAKFEPYIINSGDLFSTYDEIDFGLTKRDWDSTKDNDTDKKDKDK